MEKREDDKMSRGQGVVAFLGCLVFVMIVSAISVAVFATTKTGDGVTSGLDTVVRLDEYQKNEILYYLGSSDKSSGGGSPGCEVCGGGGAPTDPTSPSDPSSPSSPENPETDNPKLHFISVGNSDAILVESEGHFGLVDSSNPSGDDILELDACGSDCTTNNNVDAVMAYLDKLGVSKLDFVVATHNHSDHLGGMVAIAKRYINSNTTYYYRGCVKTREDMATNWKNYEYCVNGEKAMEGAGAKMYEFREQAQMSGFDFYGLKINFYNLYRDAPEEKGKCNVDRMTVWEVVNGVGVNDCDENLNSIVVKVVNSAGKSALLLADAEVEVQDELKGQVGQAEIVKAGHHGGSNAFNKDLLDNVKPSVIIITHHWNMDDDDFKPLWSYIDSHSEITGIRTSASRDYWGWVADLETGEVTEKKF